MKIEVSYLCMLSAQQLNMLWSRFCNVFGKQTIYKIQTITIVKTIKFVPNISKPVLLITIII